MRYTYSVRVAHHRGQGQPGLERYQYVCVEIDYICSLGYHNYVLFPKKFLSHCRDGETGRRTGLKIPRWQHHVGSIPTLGTNFLEGIFVKSCIFCSIYAKQIPAPIVAENDHVFVIKDIAPKAPFHLLIITKKHIPTVTDLVYEDNALRSAILAMAAELSTTIPGASAFRLVSNNGAAVGQSVYHIHFHFLAGAGLPGFE